MRTKPSLRSRLLEWVLWRLRVKGMFKLDGLRERVIKSRPADPRPPRAFYRRYRVEETVRDGRPVFTLSPKNGPVSKHVLYLHGGAYVYEMMSLQWKMLGRLLDQAEVSITVPLFPLAPEHTCEHVIAFVLAVYHTLLGEVDGKPILLLGDSAGGGLALCLSQQLRDLGSPAPGGLVLISPWLDVTCPDPAQSALEKLDPLLALPGLREEGNWYAGTLALTDPRVSPLYGDLQGLPPMLVLTGTHDLLNADVHRLQAAMSSAPASLRVSEYPHMVHVWPSLPISEATEAINEILEFLQARQLPVDSGLPPLAGAGVAGLRHLT